MSDLSQLKQQLHAIASDADRTANQISSFESTFNRSIANVQQRIGGSSRGVDRRIIEVLQNASKAARSAAKSLETASTAAKRYADSL